MVIVNLKLKYMKIFSPFIIPIMIFQRLIICSKKLFKRLLTCISKHTYF